MMISCAVTRLTIGGLIGAVILAAFAAELAADIAGHRIENLNRDWKFAKGQQPGAAVVGFDDSSWTVVRLPHDWAIAGPYEPRGDANTGKLPWRGEGWYRKRFVLPRADAGKQIYLDFDGVMAMPTVYVNGQKAGEWDYGYMSFRVDATAFVQFGRTNLVAVHVDTYPHASRWYPGAGIYRKVQLVIDPPVHLAHWGTFVSTPEVSDSLARVRVQTTVANHLMSPLISAASARREEPALPIGLETTLFDPQGKRVAAALNARNIPAGGAGEFDQSLIIRHPQRWDLETPRLYRAVSRVFVANKNIDSAETPFGIRTFEFTANDGFHLNGRRVQLHGVNLHHDHGPLGAAFFTRAMQRQLELMKDMGVNAVRTSHNPPAPELLDLCDRMGFVVWNEAFDKWDRTATLPLGASLLDHGRKQIHQFVRRDRNHPCVVVWSAGNEIGDLENGTLPNSPGLLRQMVGFFKELDPTRPVALAHSIPESALTPLDLALDVTGWNYGRRYEIARKMHPDRPIVYSESASALSTRGHYELPHPTQKDDFPASWRLSSYDHFAASWSDIPDLEFARMEQDRFVAGEFVWTGFDYLGEPTPFIAQDWGKSKTRPLAREDESRSSCFGMVDLVGIPKDRYYLYRSYWAPEKKTIHLLPHWNWPERAGTNVPVYVYTSGDSAELFLNGESQGRKSKDPRAANVMDRYRLRWENVIYRPGEIRAVAYRHGRKLGEARVRTAGAPARLRLLPDRPALRATGDDLGYVRVEAIDRNGAVCPLAMNEVTFQVTGPGAIAGVGNGDHYFPAEFQANRVALFYGQAMLIVRATEGAGGTIRVAAQCAGLPAAKALLRVQP